MGTDIINCTDDDLNAEVNTGNPIFPELPFLVKQGSCRRFPQNKMSKGGYLVLYSDKYGRRRLAMQNMDHSSLILAFLSAGKLEAKALPKAGNNKSKGTTLLVNCTDVDYCVAKGDRSAAKNYRIPSWQYITLPERHSRKDWPLSKLEEDALIVDLGKHWNDVVILTPGAKGKEVDVVSMARMRKMSREPDTPLVYAVT